MHNIPKILHLYWDLSPMSYIQTLTPISFHKFNPDWEIRLYIPTVRDMGNSCYVPDYTGKDYFDTLLNLNYIKIITVDPEKDYNIPERVTGILKSDAMRLYWLYNDGGVWSDFDVLWIKPFEALNLDDKVGNMICRYPLKEKHYNVGILYSISKHALIKEVIDEIRCLINSGISLKHQEFGVDIWNRKYSRTEDITDRYNDVKVHDYKTFYPFSVFQLNTLFVANFIDIRIWLKDSVAVHWFAGHRISKQYMNNPRSLKINCTINYIIKNLKV